MKRRLLLFLICISSYITSAQNEELDAKYWNGSQKDNTEVPEKWKDESAVILFQEYYYDYHKFGKNVKYTKSIHKRIKLQDQAAVKEFSEFNFVKRFKVDRGYLSRKKGTKVIGVKVIKPSGQEKIIAVDEEAVEKDDGEYKLAISSLEVGDIIDYYIHTEEPFVQKYGYLFELTTEILSDYYPCKEYVLKLQTENDFFINFNSYNGAPKLTEIQTKKRNDRLYELKANDLEKSDFPVWFYPQLELPFYKFQVTFARRTSGENAVYNFISEDEEIIKNEVTKEEVLAFFEDKFKRINNYQGSISRRHFKDRNMSQREMVEEAYYFLRFHRKTKYIQPSIIHELEVKNLFTNPFEYYTVNFFNNENHFLLAFGETLSDLDIPFEYIVTIPKYKGGLENILSTDEINLLIKVNTEPPIYLSYFDIFTTLEQISPYLENTKAYALPYDLKKRKILEVKEITIPKSKAADNYAKEDIEVSFNKDFSTVNISTKNKIQGHLKSGRQEELLYFFDYVEEDNKRFNSKTYFERLPEKKADKHKEVYDAFLEKIKKKRDDYVLDYLNESYEFKVKENTIEIINTGRKDDQTELVYTNQFVVENELIKRAGPNYIFEVGKLNGKQFNPDEKERKREQDIHMDFPRSYSSTITINIPEGYKVIGLENLNIKESNEIASFESSGKIVEGKLLVTTNKTYTSVDVKNENWHKILKVLDAALDFNNQKVMFEKL